MFIVFKSQRYVYDRFEQVLYMIDMDCSLFPLGGIEEKKPVDVYSIPRHVPLETSFFYCGWTRQSDSRLDIAARTIQF